MSDAVPRAKVWRFPRVVSEHAFDKLRELDCTFAEFDAALSDAEVIEEHVLVIDWTRPLHLVVVVDELRAEGTNRDGLPTGSSSLDLGLP